MYTAKTMKRTDDTTTRLHPLMIFLAMLWTSLPLSAQTMADNDMSSPQTCMHAIMVGAGWSNVLESYLSPYNYTGTDFTVIRETMRPTKLMQGKVDVQTLFQINGSILDNRAKTAKEHPVRQGQERAEMQVRDTRHKDKGTACHGKQCVQEYEHAAHFDSFFHIITSSFPSKSL